MTDAQKERLGKVVDLLICGDNVGEIFPLTFAVCTGVLGLIISKAPKPDNAKAYALSYIDLMRKQIEEYQPEKDKDNV